MKTKINTVDGPALSVDLSKGDSRLLRGAATSLGRLQSHMQLHGADRRMILLVGRQHNLCLHLAKCLRDAGL